MECEQYWILVAFTTRNVISHGQPVHIEQTSDDTLGDLLVQMLPDKILFAGEFGRLARGGFHAGSLSLQATVPETGSDALDLG